MLYAKWRGEKGAARLSGVYASDFNLSKLLPVSPFTAEPLAAFVFENGNFLALCLPGDNARHIGIFDEGTAYRYGIAVTREQYLIKCHCFTDFTGDFLYYKSVSGRYTSLFSTAPNDRIHR
jgi:hypothetical protein